jgi:hypothetical protein
MDNASAKGPARYPNGRFGPGHTGKPLGSRNRMSKRVALGLLNHYAEHEAEILEKLSGYFFNDYIRLIGRLLPRPAADDALDLEAVPAEEVERVLGAVRAALGRIEAGEGSLADIEAALLGVPSAGEGTVDNDGAGERRGSVFVKVVPASPLATVRDLAEAVAAASVPPLNMDEIW